MNRGIPMPRYKIFWEMQKHILRQSPDANGLQDEPALPFLLSSQGFATGYVSTASLIIIIFFSGRTERAQGRGAGGWGSIPSFEIQRGLGRKQQWVSCLILQERLRPGEMWPLTPGGTTGSSYSKNSQSRPLSSVFPLLVSSSSSAFLGKGFLTILMFGSFLCTRKGENQITHKFLSTQLFFFFGHPDGHAAPGWPGLALLPSTGFADALSGMEISQRKASRWGSEWMAFTLAHDWPLELC